METKNNSTLQLRQEGYTGLQGAQNQVHKVLRDMTGITPIHYQVHSSAQESVIVFMGNGICATLHIQRYNPKG